MKELGFVFMEKSELQLEGNSRIIALFGIASIWGHRMTCSSKSIFEITSYLLTPEKLRQWKKI